MGKVTYDTAAIRADAQKVRRCCAELSQALDERIPKIRSAVETRTAGRASEALRASVEVSRSRIAAACDELSVLSSGLNRLADQLELADDVAARRISGGMGSR